MIGQTRDLSVSQSFSLIKQVTLFLIPLDPVSNEGEIQSGHMFLESSEIGIIHVNYEVPL